MPSQSTSIVQSERTLELARSFLEEVRRELERAAAAGADLAPRLRTVHERAGHATPEYRTLVIPIPAGAEGASPEILSELIARYARQKRPQRLMLAVTALQADAASVLIAEARDGHGTRAYQMRRFRVDAGTLHWEEDPVAAAWLDPGEEEMILDAAFGGVCSGRGPGPGGPGPRCFSGCSGRSRASSGAGPCTGTWTCRARRATRPPGRPAPGTAPGA